MRIVFSIGIAVLIFSGCSRPPDEERIRTAIQAMKESAQARRAAGVLEHIAADFTGNNGEADRDGLSQILKIQFLRNSAIGVDVGPIEIAIDDDRATAKFDVMLSDGSGRWLPNGRETYAIVSGWRREGSAWVCYNATWSHAQ